MAYDFSSLSDFEFEELVRDLLQEEEGVRLESFMRGRDSGIDLRYACPKPAPEPVHRRGIRNEPKSRRKDTIVQCKHWLRSDFPKLLRGVKDELAKIESLNPKRYLLCTSVPLTPQRKEKLLAVLAPFCLGTGDILGKEDINNLLTRHPAVEKTHYKLWLTSAHIMQRLLHGEVFALTDITLDEIQRSLSRYVEIQPFGHALDVLESRHYCLITGIPGIGKTTLARMLLLEYDKRGFEPVVITDASSALDVYDRSRKQVIYYDDFLGQSGLSEKLGKNEDANLEALIGALGRTDSHRFILTTREYILKQAYRTYEKLTRLGLEDGKCIIQLRDFSRMDKARILYNHVYFSALDGRHLDELLEDRSYVKVIDHPNFNPRVVEQMTDRVDLVAKSSSGYMDSFLANLDNPLHIWDEAFENQISPAARGLLGALVTFPQEVLLDDLVLATQQYLEPAGECPVGTDPMRRALKELDGSFVRISQSMRSYTDDPPLAVSFHNPSVRDYMQTRIRERPRELLGLVRKVTFFEQVVTLAHLASESSQADPDVIAEECLTASSRVAGRCAYYKFGPAESKGLSIYTGSLPAVVEACELVGSVGGLSAGRMGEFLRKMEARLLGNLAEDSREPELPLHLLTAEVGAGKVADYLAAYRTAFVGELIGVMADEGVEAEDVIRALHAATELYWQLPNSFTDEQLDTARSVSADLDWVADSFEDSEDIDDLRFYARQIDEIGSEFGGDLSGLASALSEMADKAEAARDYPDDDYEPSNWGRDGHSSDASDGDIEAMFDSLAR